MGAFIRTNALALTAAFLLTACGPRLSETEVKANLLTYQKQHCPLTIVYFEGRDVQGPVGGAIARPLLRWLIKEVAVDPNYERLPESTSAPELFGVRTTRTYLANDGSYFIYAFQDYSSGFMRQPPRLIELDGCLHYPTKIEILDVSIDKASGKAASVVFRHAAEELTLAGKQLERSDLGSQLADKLRQRSDLEYRAELEKLDKTGWRVVSVTRPRRA